MTTFILDCSVSAAWCFSDETTPLTDAVLLRLRDESAAVPSIWPLEMANVMATCERRGRISREKVQEFFSLIRRLPILTESSDVEGVFERVWPLAVSQSISAYDAAYLELAMRLHIPLATSDKKLSIAA